MQIRKDDLVEVIRGEEKGKRGKVLKIIYDKDAPCVRVLLDGINMVKKHKRMTRQGQPGGIMDMPAPLCIGNVMLLCPKCGKKVKSRRELHEGRRVRVCKNPDCQEVIDKI